MHKINQEILKACDIRGIYNETLFDEDFYYLARAFAYILHKEKKKNCVLGYDCRLSSESLFKQFKKGLLDSGIKVYHFPTFISSPALYFSLDYLNADSAVMITASHNPHVYNGCKFVMNDRIFHQDDITNLNALIKNGQFVDKRIEDEESVDIKQPYIDYLLTKLKTDNLKDANIVWDGANAAATFFLKDFTDNLPSKNTLIFDTPDGTFPNHKPDPSKEENLELLKEKVLEVKADIGISFDGDGDRVGFIDDKGRYVDGNQVLIVLAQDFLKDNQGAKVMSEVKASNVLYNLIEEFGGVPVMWKVGHTNQKAKMKEDNIDFAGETSGHIFFKENNFYDDGMFAAIKILNFVFSSNMSLSQILDQFPKIIGSGEIRLRMTEEERNTFLQVIKDNLIKENRTYVDIDGMRVDSGDGFWLLRKSNTEPHITLYCESESKEDYKKVVEDLKSYISKTDYNLTEL